MNAMIQKTTITFLFCLLGIACSAFAGIDVLVYCDDNYPPYSYQEGIEVKGIYTEILRTAFSRMEGFNIQIKSVPWKRGLEYLKNGTGFALYPPYLRIKERPYIWPYSIPILDEKVVVFCRDDLFGKAPMLNWPEDYYGLTIGKNAGFELGGDKFLKAVKEGRIKVEESRGNRENLLKLGFGRTDCYINDQLSILWELKKLKEAGEYNEAGKQKSITHAVIFFMASALINADNRRGVFV